ncbi:MAG TPA: SRPBCC domain-containing protein [Marmoricola sp.]
MSGADPGAEIDIDAPLEHVWAVMLDVGSYGEWNPFVERVECTGEPHVGQPIRLHVRWANGSTVVSPERISEITPPADGSACLAYVYEGMPARLGLVRGTRYQRLTALPDGRTHYATVEEFRGPLVRFAGPGRVAEGFARHAAGLKARAESLSR